MPGKTNVFSEDILKLIFHGTPIANIADNASASPLTNLYISLHTADPTDSPATGQTTSETTYVGYLRVLMTRSGAAWSIVGKVASPVAAIDFAPCTAGGAQSVTHWGIGTAASGTGKLLYSGSVSPSILVQPGVVPRLTTASTVTEE